MQMQRKFPHWSGNLAVSIGKIRKAWGIRNEYKCWTTQYGQLNQTKENWVSVELHAQRQVIQR